MRSLDRDRRWVLVARYLGKVEETDADGRLTGRHTVSRTDPEAFLANVSAARGSAQDEMFGTALDYDRTVLVADRSFDVDESSVLWIDCVDGYGADAPDGGGAPYDYVVKRVARTPTYTAIAVKRVESP